MAEEKATTKPKRSKAERVSKGMGNGGAAGGAYFIAWFGAAVYFVQQSNGLGGFLWALVKACVWPAIIVYHVLGLLHV